LKNLDYVCELEQSHRKGDGLAAHARRDALAIPAGEGLVQGGTHFIAETEPVSHSASRQTVRQQGTLDGFGSRDEQAGPEAKSVQHWATEPGVAEQEAEHGQSREVNLSAVGSEGNVVTEPRRQLRGVRYATNPRQRCYVVESAAVVDLEPDVVA
jgi:hypothetical protein